jgi:hypothetical protein
MALTARRPPRTCCTQNVSIPEKIEGVALGPQLEDGTITLLMVTDNDYSVTQDADSAEQVGGCVGEAGCH